MPKTLDITVPDLTGTLALVTGASDGVGFEIAARLARAGAEVIIPARNLEKGEGAAAESASGRPVPSSMCGLSISPRSSRWPRSPTCSSSRAGPSAS